MELKLVDYDIGIISVKTNNHNRIINYKNGWFFDKNTSESDMVEIIKHIDYLHSDDKSFVLSVTLRTLNNRFK